MASDRTPKLGLNVFAETDIVDFGEINENSVILDNAFSWRLIDSQTNYYTGTQPSAISLPAKFDEITIKVNLHSEGGAGNIISVIHIIKEELYPNDTQQFRCGYFYNTDSQGRANGGCASFDISRGTINLNHAYLNENVVTNVTTWAVWYR